ncbi:hypothetical protein JXA88_14000 [Candidatus Fermentibacteria bacterium]|nr:hypothetical protein [Candidatus Fermentibacteria bacterium]
MRLHRAGSYTLPALVAGLLVCAPGHAAPGQLEFRSERIDITIHGDRCTIIGDYHLVSDGDSGGRMLYYPFAIGPGLPYPDSVAVTDLATGLPISYAGNAEGIRFPARIAGSDSFDFRVTYVQRTPRSMLRYILTTTQRWGRPLRSADFLIHIPRSLELTHISIAPDSVEHAAAWRIHRIHRSQFMPVCDLDIVWKEVE